MPKRTQPAPPVDPAAFKQVRDVIAPNLWVLFCGINPGVYSGITGHHFARPGNRFWPTLHRSGFTERLLKPCEEWELIDLGLGITNIASRVTATAAELAPEELHAGGEALRAKIEHFKPRVLAVLGITAYREAFGLPKASLGPQQAMFGTTMLWVLPNPSGLNAHYTPTDLGRVFAEFRVAVEDLRVFAVQKKV